MPARNLEVGDNLLLSDGTCGTIVSVKVEQLAAPETTYNFEVEDFHTYYVGDIAICVHNKCSVNQMNEQIKKGQAPKGVERVDGVNSSVKNSKIHVHFKNGTSLNFDGTVHDIKGGAPQINREIADWLETYGWNVPNIFRR